MSDASKSGLRARNLSARYVVGNPVTTRLESGVANCFPGLEFDVRNMDRRFFPGILFQFVVSPFYPVPSSTPLQQGARILYLDFLEDPMLPLNSEVPWISKLLAAYQGDIGSAIGNGRWYIDWLEQRGRRVYMHTDDLTPFDGLMVWRFVRSLEPDVPLSMGLVERGGDASTARGAVQLNAYRRKYLTPAGVIDPVFRPGELTESMCNPWSHDFRDCACHYWASNHPDVVVGDAKLTQGRETLYLDWLREDRGPSGAASAAPTIQENRPYQVDHYWINEHWQELPFVLDNREIGATYAPPSPDHAEPYRSAREMIHELKTQLAPLELTLALEYLYALFSVHAADDATLPKGWATLSDDVQFARHYVQLVAVGEMTHLRWANQLLWELDRAGLYPPGEHYEPVLALTRVIPQGGQERRPSRPRALRPLTIDTLQGFIDTERPGATLDRAYARCVATLEKKEYPSHLYELAVRVDSDGLNHFQRFSDLKKTLVAYPETGAPYLRAPLRIAKPEEAREALAHRDRILESIRRGYVAEAKDDAAAAEKAILDARGAMGKLIGAADSLARDRGLGVPFFDEWPSGSSGSKSEKREERSDTAPAKKSPKKSAKKRAAR